MCSIKSMFCFLGMFISGSMLFGNDLYFPKPIGYVNDFAGIIEQEYEDKMNVIAEEVENKTGAELVVVTIQDMGGLDEKDYTNRLFETWGIGKKEQGNGLLLFLTITERRVRIETGYGIEPIIPDGLAGDLLDRYVLPDLKNGNYGLGLYRGVIAIANIIAEDADVVLNGIASVSRNDQSRQDGRGSTCSGSLFLIILVLLIIITRGRIIPWLLLGSMMGGGRGGGFGGGGFGGGFGGFGGGMSGGGGASRGF